MTQVLAWLLGYENLSSLDSIQLTLAAPWAGGRVGLVAGLCLLLVAIAAASYYRFEPQAHGRLRAVCAGLRAVVLVMLALTLAAPMLVSSATLSLPPLVYVVVDDTRSMSIADEGHGATRTDRVLNLLGPSDASWLNRLQEAAGCRVELFSFSGRNASELHRHAVSQPLPLHSDGQVTALGDVLNQLASEPDVGRAAAVIMFGDFANNAGPPPTAMPGPIDRLSKPIYTVGVGAAELRDLSIELQMEPWAKRGQATQAQVRLRQEQLLGRTATVVLQVQPLSGNSNAELAAPQVLGERVVELDEATTTLDFEFTPRTAGPSEIIARVEPLAEEIVAENNLARRHIAVIEEALRLLYVAYEPTWEWRFAKELFQRDDLVGLSGFHTYLDSADSRVRQDSDLFRGELTTSRAEFFGRDVIFVGDVPGTVLTHEFCELVEEFVGQFGGGLVVIAGPRFGPQQLSGTPLAEMLPVILGDEASLKVEEFRLRLTPEASLSPFMRLAESDLENDQAWHNLGPLPWHQAVAALHEQAQVLAEHPTDRCDDGQTPQPLIALRRYGRGQVAYVGFNEMWRLRRKYGDRYYERFWSQLVYRLGMGDAIGGDRRFVARLDQSRYRVGQQAILTVEAFDEQFQPMPRESLAPARLVADGDSSADEIELAMAGESGVFAATIALTTPGNYAVEMQDPVTGRVHRRGFQVVDDSLERQEAVRDISLQRQLAEATRGRAYELRQADDLIADLNLQPLPRRETRHLALWNTPLWFAIVVGLMLGEWSLRKFGFLR